MLEGVIAEASEWCPKGDYSWRYAYGATETVIGLKAFFGHYTDSYPERQQLDADIKAYIEFAKRRPWVFWWYNRIGLAWQNIKFWWSQLGQKEIESWTYPSQSPVKNTKR